MKFDVAKLKELNELDFEQVAVWPKEVKIVVAIFVAIVVAGLSYWFIVKPKLPILEQAQRQEAELKLQFEAKYRIAVNLEAYKEQLAKIQKDFSNKSTGLHHENTNSARL